MLFRSGSVRCTCRGILLGVSACGDVGILFRSCPDFASVRMGPLVDVPLLLVVILFRRVF